MLTGLLALFFFLPAGLIYGRHRARGAKRAGATLRARLAQTLPMPLLVLTCLVLAVLFHNSDEGMSETGRSLFHTGNGIVDLGVGLARTIGDLGLILFFLSLPYLIGAAVAAILLVLDGKGILPIADEREPPPQEGG